MAKTSISVIVPIYNEALNIDTLYNRLVGLLNNLEKEYEIILINDGSRDNSLALIKQYAEKDAHIKYINLSRNFGHQIAVTAGLDYAFGDYVVIIDADLQDPPELIKDLMEKMDSGYDVVYAKRKRRKGESFFKLITARLFYWLLSKITSVSIPLDTGDFRIMSQRIVRQLRKMPEQHKFLRGQIAWLGFKQTFVEYDRDPRFAGKTGYTFNKMLRLALDGITSFSKVPLKFASMAGFLVSGIAFFVMIYALYARFILKDYVPGWTSIMLSVLFLGGIQLICLGIIGEYISRMHQNISSRPLYLIDESNVKETDES